MTLNFALATARPDVDSPALWHVNCNIQGMAMGKTNKIARYVKGTPGLEAARTKTKPTGLYLVELRERLADAQAALPKRKLIVKIEAKNIPHPIKVLRVEKAA